MQITDKVFVVTGGGNGMGREVVRYVHQTIAVGVEQITRRHLEAADSDWHVELEDRD